MRSSKSLLSLRGTKLQLHFLVLVSLLVLFISCKKESVPDTPPSAVNEKLVAKIKSWLDEKKIDAAEDARKIIDSLKENINFVQLRIEPYRNSEELIVVPIANKFKSKNNVDKNPINYLVMVFKAQDSITKGNIIQFISSSGQKEVTQNTFSKIFTYEDLDCSGQFTILSITDDFRNELKFENGKLKSVAEHRKKAAANNNSGRGNSCIDWYLITTVYYYDGTSDIFEEFLGTSCNGDPECNTTRTVNGRSLRIVCGGGGGNDIEYEYAVTTTRTWKSYEDPNTSSMYIYHLDQYWGKRQAGNPNGGYFTKVAVQGGGAEGFPYYMGNVSTYSGFWHYTSITNHEVQGYITSQIAPNVYYSKTDVRSFNELWP